MSGFCIYVKYPDEVITKPMRIMNSLKPFVAVIIAFVNLLTAFMHIVIHSEGKKGISAAGLERSNFLSAYKIYNVSFKGCAVN